MLSYESLRIYFKNMLEKGIKGQEEITVNENNTAEALGSGSLAVFATPAMIALMEKTARLSVAPYLEEGQSTVGTRLEVSHVAASPIGAHIHAESTLVEIDRRMLTFEVKAYADGELIGEGRHQRCIIYAERFMEKALAKQKKA